jgi:hypothetical protein
MNERVPEPPSEQPTAPYLDAVSAYGFRGSTRFHVPGHKGGEGADPGLRAALGHRALLLDVPQDIEGVDLGRSSWPPRHTAPGGPGFSRMALPTGTMPCAWRWQVPVSRCSFSATVMPA